MGVRLEGRSTKHHLQRFCKTCRHLQRVMAGLPPSRRVVGASFPILGRTITNGSGRHYHPTENDSGDRTTAGGDRDIELAEAISHQ